MKIKRFLYFMAAILIMPIVITGAVIYGVLYVLQLLFRIIVLQLEKGMHWVDKNITENIK